MRILIVGGVPGVGKTKFMRLLIEPLISAGVARHGLLEYTTYRQINPVRQLIVLGKYGTDTFAGTDKLSMAVQPYAQTFIAKQMDLLDAPPVALEGDRLFNIPFIDLCREIGNEVKVLTLSATPSVLAERRAARVAVVGKGQNQSWLNGRETKVKNVSEFAHWRKLLEPVCVDTLEMAEAAAEKHRVWVLA